MGMRVTQTDLSPEDYAATLRMTDEDPARVVDSDGAELWKITDDHYLVIACSRHDEHTGHRVLARLFPEGWACFAQATNPEGFDVFHYGPEL